MDAALASLVSLQTLDTAADAARKQLADLPAAEQALDRRLKAAGEAVDATKARLATNQTQRRSLEKDVAAVDARLSRFDDHKAAVKTNQEYTALLHEIAIGKGDKDSLEERLLVLMEEADVIAADTKSSENARGEVEREVSAARRVLAASRQGVEAEVTRLTADRTALTAGVPAAALAKYDQLRKLRKGLAVTRLNGELCEACHVRLRPAVIQQIRRNSELVTCDSCQRIVYFQAPVEGAVPS